MAAVSPEPGSPASVRGLDVQAKEEKNNKGGWWVERI